jgi:uncharacterized protein (DUF2062 family)
MLFQRREPLRTKDRVRSFVWPPGGFLRSFRYFGKRVLRLGDSPHAIGLGFACGVGVSFTPFVGFHFVMSAVLAYFLRGNLIASAIGTAVGNPLTFPAMWWSAYQVGHLILGTKAGDLVLPGTEGAPPWYDVLPILQPMLVGAVPLGLAAGFVAYLIVKLIVRTYQHARKRHLEASRAARAETE